MQSTRFVTDAMERERRRVEGLKHRNEVRRERFLNARIRTIGIDTEAIESQKREKSRLSNLEKEADAAYAREMQNLRKVLEEQELHRAQCQWDEERQIAHEREVAMSLGKNQPPKREDNPVVVELTGPSAAQHFEGEDRSHSERMRMQKSQQRQWCVEQKNEMDAKLRMERDEKMQYHEYLMEITKQREDNEKALMAGVAEMNRSIASSNLELASQARESRRRELEAKAAAEQAELEWQNESAFLTEDIRQGINQTTGRIIRGGFKGFSKDQVTQIFKENEEVLREKYQKKAEADDEEEAFAVQQKQFYGMLTQLEAEKTQQEQEDALRLKEDLLKQQESDSIMRRRNKVDQFGTIDNAVGFYSGFGQSCR